VTQAPNRLSKGSKLDGSRLAFAGGGHCFAPFPLDDLTVRVFMP
jgi:hypothetical protein